MVVYEVFANGNPTGVTRRSMTEALLFAIFVLQDIFIDWKFTVEQRRDQD